MHDITGTFVVIRYFFFATLSARLYDYSLIWCYSAYNQIIMFIMSTLPRPRSVPAEGRRSTDSEYDRESEAAATCNNLRGVMIYVDRLSRAGSARAGGPHPAP